MSVGHIGNLYLILQISFFTSLSGKDPKDMVRNILDRLMSNSLMVQYNLYGRGGKGKRAIQDLPKLKDVICCKSHTTQSLPVNIIS